MERPKFSHPAFPRDVTFFVFYMSFSGYNRSTRFTMLDAVTAFRPTLLVVARDLFLFKMASEIFSGSCV